jgi:hypothetical protein
MSYTKTIGLKPGPHAGATRCDTVVGASMGQYHLRAFLFWLAFGVLGVLVILAL